MALISVNLPWLAQVTEEIIDPTRRIIDPHHHFFVASHEFPHYELADLRADTAGHRVQKTVYLQCWEGHLEDGPEHLRPVGETAWVDSIAAEARKTPDAVQIGAMIGTCDLRLGRAVREVLDAHRAASPLFRGIRQIAAWDADPNLFSMPDLTGPDLYRDAAFREGFAVLSEMGLVFDAYQYHTQLPYLTELARAFPQTTFVLNHLATPLGVGPYAGRTEVIFTDWQRDLAEVAACPNVVMKLGGLMMPWTGFGFELRAKPPTSDELVAAQGRHYHAAIALFGASRCMFESNFPVDKIGVSYDVLWNAFKKIAARYTEAEQDAMFYGTAARVYDVK
jgi:predicted TIM-barrel fold metal-dependent hydrolase